MLPLSIIMDIVRLVSYHAHGFIVFICVLQFVFKFMGLWYAYRLCKEWEAGGERVRQPARGRPGGARRRQGGPLQPPARHVRRAAARGRHVLPDALPVRALGGGAGRERPAAAAGPSGRRNERT